MAKGRNEIKAAVYAIVQNVSSIQSTLILEEALVLLINVLQDGAKAVRVVNGITKAGCVHNGKT